MSTQDYRKMDWSGAADHNIEKYTTAQSSTSSEKADLTKYFNPQIPKGETNAQISFRILPNQENFLEFYHEGKFHSQKINGQYRKFYDPAQDGEPSPLNDMYKELKKGDAASQELAKTYYAGTYYILRGIERGKEHEGVKFWRFAKVRNGGGNMDKIVPIMRSLDAKKKGLGAIWNPIEGRDLTISLTRDSNGYAKVSAILQDDISPLSSDEQQLETWLNDTTTWKDVFKKKPTEYLQIIAEGGEPVWDNGKYVAKGETATHETSHQGTADIKEPPIHTVGDDLVQGGSHEETVETTTKVAEYSTISEDDLPF